MSKPLIIDCDPGVDDAIALLLAFASPEFDLLGITTVAGNVPLALTQSNARKIGELAGRPEVPVYAGCPRPLLRSLETAEHVHGATGLQGADLLDPQTPLQAQHGVDFLIETLTHAAAPVTLAALGPLTNLAVALIKQPNIQDHIAELVLMGGAFGQGNVTPSAEFNIYVDPHAAQVVFGSEIPLTMMGLDVTHQVLTTPERLLAIEAIGSPIGTAAAGMLKFYGEHDRQQYGLTDSPLHDPCVIAYLLQPDLFTCRSATVTIETASPLTMGRTVVDWQADGAHHVAVGADADRFYALLVDRLRHL